MWTDLLARWSRRRPALTPNRPPLTAEDTGVIRLPLEWSDPPPLRRPGATVTTERALRKERLARGESLPTATPANIREGQIMAANLEALRRELTVAIQEDLRAYFGECQRDDRRPLTWDSASIATSAALLVLKAELT